VGCRLKIVSSYVKKSIGGVYQTNSRGGEENPVHRRNTTVNVDKIRGFHPPDVWTQTFVFLLTLARESTERGFLYASYGNPMLQNITSQIYIGVQTFSHLAFLQCMEPHLGFW
jgi:hypothetical protein